MLEVKNLVKEYRPKKGKPVRAIDGISLKFPEKGMVFILGKSGSGKSSLLNLLGGLDRYDSGEIVIKGKSSKDFSQSEFDSYRNTYLGFIFQEYNILNDFNVAQNIAIALQLQGQKATDEKINEILKEVDLVGYGARKPSELSGGQKQRVAIARALVKNPEIIMADEPTGALDSKTGLQVFDTLKNLSKDKLVITITHDRDFAEMYGDRVIELKDGKVISDIEKYSASATEVSEGIKVTDDKVISIKKGYTLTPRDVELINGYLQKNEMLLSVDDKVNGDLKRFARIDSEGKKESFRDTDETKIVHSEEKKFRLIKSRLPLKNKIIIGASGLKNKPIRLIMTILLSLVAFTMFGLADTMASYNKIKATEKSVLTSDISAATFTKTEKQTEEYDGETYTFMRQSKFSEGEIAAFSSRTGLQFRPVLAPSGYTSLSNYLKKSPMNYYGIDFGGMIQVDEGYLREIGFSVEGKLPSGKKEIAVSKFVYERFAQYGYKYGEKEIAAEEIKGVASFLSKKPVLYLNGEEKIITAVIDTKFDNEKYSVILNDEEAENGIVDYFLQQEMFSDVSFGYHGMIFVAEELWNESIEEADRNASCEYTLTRQKSGMMGQYINGYAPTATLTQAEGTGTVYYFGEHTGALADDEIVLGVFSAINGLYVGEDENANNELETIRMNLYSYYEVKRGYYADMTKQEIRDYGITIVTDEEARQYMTDTVLPFFRRYADFYSETFDCRLYSTNGNVDSFRVKVVGVYFDEQSQDGYLILPDAICARQNKEFRYDFAIAAKPTAEQWKMLIKLHYEYEDGDGDVSYLLQNSVIFTIGMLDGIIETLSQIFLYVGIGFALFAALMLTNFISTSIVYKRREIGILRAVGARGSDVYGIFAIESVIIALINFVLATVATGVITAVIEASFRKEYHMTVSILNFGIRQVGLIFGVAVVVALIASFLPTFRISRQRPVDAIKK